MKNFNNLFSRYFWIVLLCPLVLLSGCNNSSSPLAYRVISTGDANTGLAAEEVELSNISGEVVSGLSWSITDDAEQGQVADSDSNFFEVYDGTNAFKNWCSGSSCADSCSNLANHTLAVGESCILYIRSVMGEGEAGAVYQATLSIGNDNFKQAKKYHLSNSVTLYAGGDFAETTDQSATNLGHLAEYTNGNWQAVGSQEGLNGVVHALITDGVGNLYAGGPFTKTGDDSVTGLGNIAEFREGQWQAVGSQGGFNGGVKALMMDSAGNLYAGGEFTATGDGKTTLGYIAEYINGSWQTVGTQGGFSDFVHALAVDSAGNLYAGGEFETTGDGNTTLGNIAEYTNGSWQAVGSQGGFNDRVNALMTDGTSNLYAGGKFTATGGAEPLILNRIAKFSNNDWGTVSNNQEGFLGTAVYALTMGSDGDFYAGGLFTTTGDEETYLGAIAKYTDGSWQALGGHQGLNNSVRALTTDGAGNLYAGGDFTATGDSQSSFNYIVELRDGVWQTVSSQNGFNYFVAALTMGTILTITPLNSD